MTGRSGSIVFNLSFTGQAANGDVVMIPRGYGRALVPYGATTTAGMQTQNVGGSQVLTIKLVRVSGDTVSGVLDAYRDPQCDCPVVTTFTGTVNGNTIDGTFTTRGSPSAAPQDRNLASKARDQIARWGIAIGRVFDRAACAQLLKRVETALKH